MPTPAALWGRFRHQFFRTEQTELLLRGSIASLLIRGTGVALRFLSGFLIARMLGASGYGVYAYAVTWLGLVSVPSMLGLDNILLRFVPSYRENGRWGVLAGLLRFSLLLGVTVSGLAALGIVGALLALTSVDWTLRLTMIVTLSILPIVILSQTRSSTLRGLDQPALAQIPENLIYPILLMLFAGGAWWFGEGAVTVPLIAVANALAWVLTFIAGTVLLFRKLPREIRGVRVEYERAPWLRMVPSLVFTGVAYNLLSKGDLIVLGFLGTSYDVGIYTVASRGGEMMLFMYDAITLGGAAIFSAIYARGDMNELQRFTTLAARTILYVSLPIYVAYLFLAPWVLGLFGPEFVEGTAALRLLATTYFLSSLGGFVIIMMYMIGAEREVVVVMAFAAALDIGLAFLLIPAFGVVGAAAASGITLVVLKGALVYRLHRRTGILSLPIAHREVRP